MAGSINAQGHKRDVIVIGADLPAIVGVVIHRGGVSHVDWSAVLGSKTHLRTVEPLDGDVLTPGTVYVAPADVHLTFVRGKVRLDG
jgi:chemotaxis response regulator CheB